MAESESIDFNYAYNYCKEIATRHYENFPVGSLLIPKAKRKYIFSIYAFARYADDIADSDIYTEDVKLKKLNELETELDKIESDNVKEFIPDSKYLFTALYNTMNELKMPSDEFRNLLKAFKQDASKLRYTNFDDLIKYSEYSANPVGHLVLYVFGYNPENNKQAFKYSDSICTALQLTNFWQDVSEDLKINRIYIPDDLMRENNYNSDLLISRSENDDFIRIIKILVDKTRVMFNEGRKISDHTRGRLRMELKAVIAGGVAILNKIEESRYRVISKKVKINSFDKLKIIGKIILK
ncbi:MAG TPA: squalene synthase HpnC [Ignavibacteria bacterium]|nr:squalene synthase HpnC [Ignavibacteria bacterium]